MSDKSPDAPKCHFSQYFRAMEEVGLRSESIQRKAIFPSGEVGSSAEVKHFSELPLCTVHVELAFPLA